MATQSYQQRSDSTAPRTSAPNLGRPFVVPAVQTKEDSSEQLQTAPDQSVSLLTNRYQVSAAPVYQPNWIARAQATTPETSVPEEKEEQVEETVQRSIDGAPPEAPIDPADDPEDIPIQTKLTIGQPNDRYEQEADRVAEQVMSMPDTAVQRTVEDSEETEIQAKPIAGITRFVQRKATGPTKADSGLETQLNDSKGQGSVLSDDVRSFMEPRFGVDFGQVRVHTDGNAVQMNKSLGAKAFAHGSDLYYGAGNSPGNDALTAHELTHVVQQTGGGVRKNNLPKSSGGAMPPKAIANDVKSFKRGGEIQAKILPEQAIAQQTETIGGKSVQCKTLVTATTTPQIQRNVFGDAWDAVKSAPGKALEGGKKLVSQGADYLREKLLGPVAQLFTKIPGYSLLTLALGKDPVSGAKVERNATNLVQAVLSIIPGGDRIFKNLQQSKGLEKTFTWLNQQVTKLNLTWDVIKNLFKRTWDSLSAGDVVNPGAAFEKVKNVFAEPIGRIVKFAGSVGQKVLEFVLEGAMAAAGSGASRVMEVLKKMGASFMTVVKDPIGFVNNLVKAVKGGFSQFMANIGTHLKNGLMGWLTGAMAGGGIKMPAKFDLQGITSLVLQVLGITYAKIRAILVKRLGEKRVATLEKTSKYVQMLVTQGIDGMMDKMVEFLGDLKDTIVTGIQNWVIDRIIKTAIPKLISMFTPAGAIVQAALSIYNTIMFFIEKAEQIAALVQSVLDSLANIASGAVDAAIGFIERSMAKAVPLIINFLARWLGLGNVSAKIRLIIQKVQTKVDAALEKVAAWIGKMPGGGTGVAAPAGVIASGAGKPSSSNKIPGVDPSPGTAKNPGAPKNPDTDKRTYEQKQADLNRGVIEAEQLARDENVSIEQLKQQLPKIKLNHQLVQLNVVIDSQNEFEESLHIEGEVNPRKKGSQIKKEKIAAGKVDLSELNGWRPGWRKSTDEALAERPDNQQYYYMRKGQLKLKKTASVDRRHVVAFEVIKGDLKSKIEGKTYSDAYKTMQSMGYKPLAKRNIALVTASRKYLTDKFNDTKNLYVGDAAENQEMGRKIGVLLPQLKKEQEKLRGLKGLSKPQIKAERPIIIANITRIVDELSAARLDLPRGKVIKAAQEYLDMLEDARERELDLITSLET